MTQKSKDIQSQTEPYIVNVIRLHDNADYADWIAGTRHRYLFCAKNIEELKQLVSVIGAEKMHQDGAELKTSKLHQCVGVLKLAIKQGNFTKSRTIDLTIVLNQLMQKNKDEN